MEGEYCRVHIRVRAQTTLGQCVAIGGTTFSLGYFDKTKVVELVTTPEAYPVWYTPNPLIIPRNQLVQYKYCIVEGGKVRAFERTDRRSLLPSDIDTVVEDDFIPTHLEGQGQDSEVNLLNEISDITGDRSQKQSKTNTSTSRVIIVCYHLPVIVERTGDTRKPFTVIWSESLIAKSKGSISNTRETVWFGSLSVPGDAPTQSEISFLTTALKAMNCFPVFLDEVGKAKG